MNASEINPRDDLSATEDPHAKLDIKEDRIETLRDEVDKLNSLRNSITSAFCIAVPLCMINSATQGVGWVLSDGQVRQSRNEPITQEWLAGESRSILTLSGGAGLILLLVWAAIFFSMRRVIKGKNEQLQEELHARREIQREVRKADNKK